MHGNMHKFCMYNIQKAGAYFDIGHYFDPYLKKKKSQMPNGDTVELTFVSFQGKYFRCHCCCHIILDKCKRHHCIPHLHPKDGKLLSRTQNTARRGKPHACKTHGRATLLFFSFWRTGIESIHHDLRKIQTDGTATGSGENVKTVTFRKGFRSRKIADWANDGGASV